MSTTPATLWQSIKDRLMKYDTLHGLYMVPVGIVGLWVTFTHLQYILTVIGVLIFMYAIIEGVRLIGYNPFKNEAKLVAKAEEYLHLYQTPADGVASTAAPASPATPTPPAAAS